MNFNAFREITPFIVLLVFEYTSSSSELYQAFLDVMFPHDCTAIIIAMEWKQFWKMLWNFKVPIIIMRSQQFSKKTDTSAWHQLPLPLLQASML